MQPSQMAVDVNKVYACKLLVKNISFTIYDFAFVINRWNRWCMLNIKCRTHQNNLCYYIINCYYQGHFANINHLPSKILHISGVFFFKSLFKIVFGLFMLFKILGKSRVGQRLYSAFVALWRWPVHWLLAREAEWAQVCHSLCMITELFA